MSPNAHGYFGKKPKKDVFKLYINLTKDAAAQRFQYRILHRIFQVKNYPKKIKASNNVDCTFCGNSTEHIFITCSYYLSMWSQFREWLLIVNCSF